MSLLESLYALAGEWVGTNKLYDPTRNIEEDSPATATIRKRLNDKFVQFDYTWQYDGAPQEGSLWISSEPKLSKINVHWIDSWHMGRAVLVCKGDAQPDGSIVVLGSYAAPPGPDWGWKMVIKPVAWKGFEFLMFNITPDGEESPAVVASFEAA